MTTTAHEHVRNTRPSFGLRRQPGRLALVFMRTPRPLYRHGWGWLLGHTFLLITHKGRKIGKRRETVAMALLTADDPPPGVQERPGSFPVAVSEIEDEMLHLHRRFVNR